jgi:hypothetical protein
MARGWRRPGHVAILGHDLNEGVSGRIALYGLAALEFGRFQYPALPLQGVVQIGCVAADVPGPRRNVPLPRVATDGNVTGQSLDGRRACVQLELAV